METPPLPLPPSKKKGSSAEKIVLIAVLVVWVSTGVAGLGLLARSVFATGKDLELASAQGSIVLAPSSPHAPSVQEDQPPRVKAVSDTKETPQEPTRLAAIPPPQEEQDSPKVALRVARAQPTPEPTPAANQEPANTPNSLSTARAQVAASAIAVESVPHSRAAPQAQAMEQASVCTLSEQACIDLCPDGSAFTDGMDVGGTAEWEVCEQACRFGRIRCVKGITEDPCGHFHGACRYHCYEESYSEECEDSCDEGRDTCSGILAPPK
jgi:hypothetical protein